MNISIYYHFKKPWCLGIVLCPYTNFAMYNWYSNKLDVIEENNDLEANEEVKSKLSQSDLRQKYVDKTLIILM